MDTVGKRTEKVERSGNKVDNVEEHPMLLLSCRRVLPERYSHLGQSGYIP